MELKTTTNNTINPTIVDVETTTSNKGHPFDPRNKLVSYATLNNTSCRFKYHSDPDFNNRFEEDPDEVVGFNIKFDLHWLYPSGCVPDFKVWDCQLAEHVYTGQKAQFISLNECLERYELETKLDVVKDLWEAGVNTDEIAPNILQEYNVWDVRQEQALYVVQQKLLNDKQRNLVYLLGEDLKVLVAIERAGLLFDTEGAQKALTEYKQTVLGLEEQLNKALPVIEHGQFNWDSGDHLSCFLYGGVINFDWYTESETTYKSGIKKGTPYLKRSWQVESVTFKGLFKPLEGTEVAKTKDKPDAVVRYYQTDSPTLQSLRGPKESKYFVSLLQKRSETQKLVEMLESLFKQFEDKQWKNNLVHGQYNQNVAVTGRLSSSGPNMQNIPPEIDRFFISRYD